MFTSLLGQAYQTLKAPKERRKFVRVKKSYQAVCLVNAAEKITAIGMDISRGGLGIMVQRDIAPNEFDVHLTLGTRIVPVRVRQVNRLPGMVRGKPALRYGLKFIAVAADDFDRIGAFIDGKQILEESKTAAETQELRSRPDDAGRLIPKNIQRQIYLKLVEMNRLPALREGVEPPVRFQERGTRRKSGTREYDEIVVHSRLADQESTPFATRVQIYSDGEIVFPDRK